MSQEVSKGLGSMGCFTYLYMGCIGVTNFLGHPNKMCQEVRQVTVFTKIAKASGGLFGRKNERFKPPYLGKLGNSL